MVSVFISKLTHLLPIVAGIVAVLIAVALLLWLLVKLLNLRHLLKQDVVYLELTPPAWTDRLPAATEELFAALHGLGTPRQFIDRLIRRETSFAMEIVSTSSEGIRFILRVPENKASAVEQQIISYVPDVKVKRTQGYFKPAIRKKIRILAFKQTRHFAFPLKGHESLSQHDPIGYITNAMTKLAEDELVSIQLVITPTYKKEAEQLGNQILSNEDLLSHLDKRRAPLRPKLFHGVNTILFAIMDSIGNAYHGPSKISYYGAEHYAHQRELEYQKQVARRIKPVRTLSYFEQELVESIHDKLAQPLFKTELRVLLDCETKQEAKQRKQSLASALNLFSVPRFQSLKVQRQKYGWLRNYQLFTFMYRLPALPRPSNLFSAAELAGLYHFPHSVSAKTENVVKSLSKTLPAPVSLKGSPNLDVVLGENHHNGSMTPIGLTAAERERHVYVIGGTGNGKTTMLQYSIVQDIQNGKGIAVIDPHGDLSETLLRHIPKERFEDVIYFHPYDIDHPVAMNLLELPEGLSESELHIEKDFVTEAIVSVFRKTFSDDDTGGHRIEYILRNAIRTAFTVESPTLFTLFDLLTEPTYRKSVTDKLEDKRLKNFWKEEFGKAGAMQRVKLGHGVTTKLGRFDGSEQVKRVMEQPVSTINFDDILASGKILICNFAKGELGEDTSELFGISVLAKLQLAALRRARQSESTRTPFYLYVDEFQNFATLSFVQLLSEARKYRLFLTMAEQSTSQQDQQQLVDIILANVGTVVCFRSGSPADERYILPLFKPYLKEGEIASLSVYNFYMRIAALDVQEPLSGITIRLTAPGDEKTSDSVKLMSIAQYATEYNKPGKSKPVETVKKPENKSNQDNKPDPNAEHAPIMKKSLITVSKR